MTSAPTASIIAFISRACRSPPWFSTASFTPESAIAHASRDRLHHVVDVHLDLRRSGSPPSTQRMHVAPKICDALRPRATCSSSVPSCALNDRELGHTEPNASCSLMPSRSACSRIARIAGFVAEHRRRQRDHRPRQLDRAQVVEELDRREVVAADTAVDRPELDRHCRARALEHRGVRRGGRTAENEASPVHGERL
jgi:hypothetical protein